MPRQARKTSGTGIYHVMLRGINRQDIFEDDEDYMQFQRSLHQLVECYDEPAHSISDTGIKELLRLQYSNDNAMDVQNFEKNQRNKIIKELCNQGAGFRQLARITGFSYGIIQRVVTDQSPLIYLKTTNAHACQGVSFVAFVIHAMLLWYFKRMLKNYWPNISKKNDL